MALTEREVAFQKATKAALKEWDDLQEQQLHAVRTALTNYRNEVVAATAGIGTDWQEYQLEQTLKRLQETSRQVGLQISKKWEVDASKATALGLAAVDNPLKALGIPAYAYPAALPVRQLAILNKYVPSLIVNTTAETQQKVANLMRQALMGGVNQANLLKKVGNLVGPLHPGKARPAGTIFSATERRISTIMRTEMNRVHNLVKTTRQNELAEKYPGIGKTWLHRPSPDPRPGHAQLDGVTVYPAQGEKFHVNGIPAEGPHDPQLGAADTINCHCTTITTYNAEAGQAAVEESPYVPGDGKDIPSAKAEIKAPAIPAPETMFPPGAGGDPDIQAAHRAGKKAWAQVKGKKAAQAAYDEAYQQTLLKRATEKALQVEHAAQKATPGLEAKMAYHQAKREILAKGGAERMAGIEAKKIAKIEAAILTKAAGAADDVLESAKGITAVDGALEAGEMPNLAKLQKMRQAGTADAKSLKMATKKAEDEIVAFMKKKAEPVLKAEQAATTGAKTWDMFDLHDFYASRPLPASVDAMGPAERQRYYADLLKKRKAALDDAVLGQKGEKAIGEAYEAMDEAAKAHMTAQADLRKFAEKISQEQWTEAEIIKAQRATAEQLNEMIQAKRKSRIPLKRDAGGPARMRKPSVESWDEVKERAAVRFEGDPDEALRYWDKYDRPDIDDIRDVAENYKGGGYQQMNERARGLLDETGWGDADPKMRLAQLDDQIQALDRAFDGRWVFPEDTVVYRGISADLDVVMGIDKTEDLQRLVGTVFYDDGFVSTNLAKARAFQGDVSMEIFVPKGARGLPYQWTPLHRSEIEVVLPRQTKFKVLEILEDKATGKVTLRVEALI